MNANAKAWVEALRSGQYQQTRNTLASDRGYCCLGVACELAIAHGIAIKKESETDHSGFTRIRYDRNTEYLPPAVQEWLGLRTDNGFYDDHESLTDLNDTHRNSFAEIASIIENEPRGLFKV